MSRDAGFTLIELLIVIVIIAMLVGGATYAVGTITKSELRSAASRVAATMRFAFDRAMMTGSVIRVALDFDKRQLWLERSDAGFVLATGDSQLATTDEREAKKPEEPATGGKSAFPFGGLFGDTAESDEQTDSAPAFDTTALVKAYERDLEPVEPPKSLFTPLKGPDTKRISLPPTVRISAVMSAHLESPTEEGVAYLYFFPQGHTEPAIVHLVNKVGNYYSVVVRPLTGQARVYSCKYRIPEDFSDSEQQRMINRDPCEATP